MKINWIFRRYLLFALTLLILIPTTLSFFVYGASYYYQIRTIFLLQKIYLTLTILTLVLLILAYKKIEKYERQKQDKQERKKKRNESALYEHIIFLTCAIFFFVIAFSTQINYEKILSEGIGFTDRVNFDSNRFLAPEILGDNELIPSKKFTIFSDNEEFSRTTIIEAIPFEPTIVWHGGWKDRNKDGILSNCSILLGVNGKSFDVTNQYEFLKSGQTAWMSLNVNPEIIIEGKNVLSIKKTCPDAVIMDSQGTYIDRQSRLLKDGKATSPPFDEILIFIKQDNSMAHSILFKFGFIFRVIAVILLFIAIFGLAFAKFIYDNAKIEVGFAFIYSIIMYWFSEFVRGYWSILSKGVIYANYLLLKISLLNPYMDFSNPRIPIIGIKEYSAGIVDSCSGIESIGYFILAYSILIFINWHDIDIKKAIIFLPIGLAGTFFVNVLRIYLLILIAKFISREFATNTYHTNAGMILFIMYFVWFWTYAQKHILNQKKAPLKKIKHKRKDK